MSNTEEIIDTEESNTDNDNKQRNNKNNRDEITEENCRFDEGQILNFVRVRFPGHNKSYPFLIGKRKLMYGQKVMGMSDRGMAVGYINSFNYDLPFSKDMLPLRYISKVASDEDIQKEKEIYKEQKNAENICQRLIEKHNLEMNMTHVEFTQFGKKVVFYFVAAARVDFRGLVKDLVQELKLRIELRQISVRDRAASMGALGPCGRELCCSSFLSRYGNVSVKMAKNQNLTLNYSKLNGVCGQLKCCLQYEDDVYAAKRKRIPDEGSFVTTKNGDKGKVHRIHILSEQFDVLTTQGLIKRYVSEMFDTQISQEDCKFPNYFDNISDETATIIGLTEAETKKVKQFERDLAKIKLRAHKFAHTTYNELTDSDDAYIEPTIEEKRDSSPDLSMQIQFKNKPEEKLPEVSQETAVAESKASETVASDDQTQQRPRPKKNNRYHKNKKNFNKRPNKNNTNKT